MRDDLDLDRAMQWTAWALLPCALIGSANAGYQALAALGEAGPEAALGWRGTWLGLFGLDPTPESPVACLVYGLACLLPVLGVAWGVGTLWARIFARARQRPAPAMPLALALLFALMLPPTIPLWQVALGISFGVVMALEIFGGLGRNVLNPAVAGVAFLYFAYPASFSGEGVWVAVEGAGAEPLLVAAGRDGIAAFESPGPSWGRAVLGWVPGSLGETSALACALGGALLVYAGLASWRVIAGGVLGLVATVALANAFGDPTRPLVGAPWSWHLVVGSFAFGLAFLATDPVTSASTPAGRWIYGALIGAVVGLVRVFNPAHAEGVLMAILLGNVLAPLIDHAVVRLHVRRRRRRLG